MADGEALREFTQAVDRLVQALDLIKTKKGQTTDPGIGDAAVVELGPLRRLVDIHFDTNGTSTMTVEVSNDGHEWHQFDTQDLTDDQDIFQLDVPWEWIRAHADQNVDKIEITSQGGL